MQLFSCNAATIVYFKRYLSEPRWSFFHCVFNFLKRYPMLVDVFVEYVWKRGNFLLLITKRNLPLYKVGSVCLCHNVYLNLFIHSQTSVFILSAFRISKNYIYVIVGCPKDKRVHLRVLHLFGYMDLKD